MKRMFDLVCAVVLLALLSPLLLSAALAIRICMGSPVLFRQIRPGLKGIPFRIYKFRTMTNQRDAQGNLLPDHLRVNSLGRFLRRWSIDELPQLLNILQGDLSLVGPRPLLVEYLDLYTPEQARRHEVRPGITGWAQIHGRNAVTWEDKFALDVWYVDHCSLGLDLAILLRTAVILFRKRGIDQDDRRVGSEPFRGTRQKEGTDV